MWLRTSWNGSLSARILGTSSWLTFLSIADAPGMTAFSAACMSASSCLYSGDALICFSNSASPPAAVFRYFEYSFTKRAW